MMPLMISPRMPPPITMPIIGKSRTTPGLFHAFGFCGHGFQLGPGVGDVMAGISRCGPMRAGIIPGITYRSQDWVRALNRTNAPTVSLTYINCSAAVKALSDIIVTSSNAEKIVRTIPLETEILFAPDRHLGAYLSKKTGRAMGSTSEPTR